jgi:hypothetical protein
MERRQDRLTALMIEAALHTTRTHGLQDATLAMAEYGVPHEVIIRVLVLQRQRRSTLGASIAFYLVNPCRQRVSMWLSRYRWWGREARK